MEQDQQPQPEQLTISHTTSPKWSTLCWYSHENIKLVTCSLLELNFYNLFSRHFDSVEFWEDTLLGEDIQEYLLQLQDSLGVVFFHPNKQKKDSDIKKIFSYISNKKNSDGNIPWSYMWMVESLLSICPHCKQVVEYCIKDREVIGHIKPDGCLQEGCPKSQWWDEATHPVKEGKNFATARIT